MQLTEWLQDCAMGKMALRGDFFVWHVTLVVQICFLKAMFNSRVWDTEVLVPVRSS